MNNHEERIKQIREKLGIRGIMNVKKEVKVTESNSARFETKSFTIDYFLYQSYKLGEEFLMQEMSETLRSEGWKPSDVSGQLYSKKKAGLLTSRKPSSEEAELLGKNISIWSLTESFCEKMAKEMVDYEEWVSTTNANVEEVDATDETAETD